MSLEAGRVCIWILRMCLTLWVWEGELGHWSQEAWAGGGLCSWVHRMVG